MEVEGAEGEEEEEEGIEEGVDYGRWVVITTEALFLVISEEVLLFLFFRALLILSFLSLFYFFFFFSKQQGMIYIRVYQPSKTNQTWELHYHIPLHSLPTTHPLPSLSHLSLSFIHNTLVTLSPYSLTFVTFKLPSSSSLSTPSSSSSSSSSSQPSLPASSPSLAPLTHYLSPTPSTYKKATVSKAASLPSFPSFHPSFLSSSPIHFCMFVCDFFPGSDEGIGGEGGDGKEEGEGEKEQAKFEREVMKNVMESFGNCCMTKVCFFFLIISFFLN